MLAFTFISMAVAQLAAIFAHSVPHTGFSEPITWAIILMQLIMLDPHWNDVIIDGSIRKCPQFPAFHKQIHQTWKNIPLICLKGQFTEKKIFYYSLHPHVVPNLLSSEEHRVNYESSPVDFWVKRISNRKKNTPIFYIWLLSSTINVQK